MALAIVIVALALGFYLARVNARAYGRRLKRRLDAERQELREIDEWLQRVRETA